MSKSIGVDLGTTNSVVAIKGVAVEIIKNSEGELITPSCVAIKKKKLMGSLREPEYIVGKNALDWIKQDPANTVSTIKRLMGRSFDNPDVQKIVADKRQLINITRQTRGTENSLVIILENKEYTPERISSEILKKLCKDAESYLEDKVEYAVITVPAYFNDKQKHATRTAAAMAGLKVQRLLPEPTAAAISFGVDQIKEEDVSAVMVFDFGGGTFDLSVLTISGAQFIEQGKGGNMWLGGEDIDRELVDYVLETTAAENEIEDIYSLIDRQEDRLKYRFLGELKSSVEQAKIRLSHEQVAYIEIPGILKDEDGDLLDVDVTLTRTQFESIIQPVMDNAMELTHKLLEDIHMSPDLIDRVLLVGGSSTIPCIIAAVKEMFGSDKVLIHERPMLAIAEGAAILSHRLSENYECPDCGKSVMQTDTSCSHCGFDLEKYIIDHGVLDIVHTTAHDYCIVLENGDKYMLVERNTPLPCERTEVFKLVDLEQRLVHMSFLNIVNEQKESIGDLWLCIDNEAVEKLWKTLVEGEDKPSNLSVEITLKIDENNIVSAAASIKELPDVQLSKTLSRGRADETLLRRLEAMTDEVNEKDYDIYLVEDMTARMVSIIKDINNVIDENTGEVLESAYKYAEMNIDKIQRFKEQNIHCYPTIYYAEELLDRFGMVLSSGERSKLQKTLDRLKLMNTDGTYDENLAAFNDLTKSLVNSPVTFLMLIEKAMDLCERYEPERAPKFQQALSKFMTGVTKSDPDNNVLKNDLQEILIEATAVIDKYDNKTAKLHKGITR
jgi:molecular chaperone DnaK